LTFRGRRPTTGRQRLAFLKFNFLLHVPSPCASQNTSTRIVYAEAEYVAPWVRLLFLNTKAQNLTAKIGAGRLSLMKMDSTAKKNLSGSWANGPVAALPFMGGTIYFSEQSLAFYEE
jgi:hypothetical protein